MTRDDLIRVYNAVGHLTEMEAQDRTLVVDMSQDMLYDLIETGELKPMVDYVKRYCDVIDGPDDAARIAAEIEAAL